MKKNEKENGVVKIKKRIRAAGMCAALLGIIVFSGCTISDHSQKIDKPVLAEESVRITEEAGDSEDANALESVNADGTENTLHNDAEQDNESEWETDNPGVLNDVANSNAQGFPVIPFITACVILVAAFCALIIVVSGKKKRDRAIKAINSYKQTTEKPLYVDMGALKAMDNSRFAERKSESANGMSFSVGSIHNIGKRSSQQDSMAVTELGCGLLAVVADGMGGLADGDKVSQRVVMTMLKAGAEIKNITTDNVLYKLASMVNNEINNMLGAGHGISCGSTLISVFISEGYFHWVSVGDSRIYLYRGGCLMQLNREHNYESELIVDAVNGSVSFDEVKTNSKRHGLTSFIGMGRLADVDGNVRPVKLAQGDKLLLMSDGVYNTLSENEMMDVLAAAPDANAAAAEFEKRILRYNKAKQDNFTAVIIDILLR